MLYAPTCNLLLYLGHPESRNQLPQFDEDCREPSMEDVLFCLEAQHKRQCRISLHEEMQVEHVYREAQKHFLHGLQETFLTFRKMGKGSGRQVPLVC